MTQSVLLAHLQASLDATVDGYRGVSAIWGGARVVSAREDTHEGQHVEQQLVVESILSACAPVCNPLLQETRTTERGADAVSALTDVKDEIMKRLKSHLYPNSSSLPTPYEDQETEALHTQVLDVVQRIVLLRETVPTNLQSQLQQHLMQMRPEAGNPANEEHRMDTDAMENCDKEALSSISTGSLQSRLETAALKAPHLRVQLRECLERVERVTAAVAASHTDAAPTTVERALLGTPSATRGPSNSTSTPASGATPTPGAVITRKAIVRDVRPIPYGM